ncbi:ATP-dependent RNA helicase [Lobulomyces angularis]|nr:ATP-dependent RNA helicase [Lobulomyces angularis]
MREPITSLEELDWVNCEDFFQEIEGVDVHYETLENGGKMMKYVQVREAKPAVHTKSEPEFIHIDDFPMEESGSYKKQKLTDSSKCDKEGVSKVATIITKPDKKALNKIKNKKNLRKEKKLLAKEKRNTLQTNATKEEIHIGEQVPNPVLDMSNWSIFELHPLLISGLHDLGFTSPTEIQKKTLPFTMKYKRDLLGAAQTGSGKTLAFGLPILQYLQLDEKKNTCVALILVPTRELSMQVTEHLQMVSKYCKSKIVSIVGGLSKEKQRRLVTKNPNIIVATPGRLWDLLQDDIQLLKKLRNIKFLVLDEADRMLESGHFKDLEMILNSISVKNSLLDDEINISINKQEPILRNRRTFLFSATLLPDLEKMRDNGKQKKDPKKSKKRSSNFIQVKNEDNGETVPTIADLVKKIEFCDPNPVYINLVLDNNVTAKGLIESKIQCLTKEKDLYLYYILLRYPGRTLVFANSIDAIRRLVPLLTLLNVKCWGIHAEMQQRQRLKNLERFTESKNSVLISSDVSARGLDIPLLDHVIHYQIPRTPDLYVHRSGRTGRGNSQGVVIALCSPEDHKVYRRICHALRKVDLPDFPVDQSIISSLKERVSIANSIDVQEHKLTKLQHEKAWLKNQAVEAELSLDESSDDEESTQTLNTKEKIKFLKATLQLKLSQPLIPKGISKKYITSGTLNSHSNLSLPEILLQNLNEENPALPTKQNSKALGDIKAKILNILKRKRSEVKTDDTDLE